MRKVFSAVLGFMSIATLSSTVKAITWTNGGEDLSSINAQITCDASNVCTLSPVTGDTITLTSDRLLISSPTDVVDFVFDSGDDLNPYIMTGTSSSTTSFLLDFTNGSINDVSLNGNFTNTLGGGIAFRSLTANTIDFQGAIDAQGYMGLYLYQLTTNGITIDADIASADQGIFINGVTSGDTLIDGTINAGGIGIQLGPLYNGPEVAYTGNIDINASITSADQGISMRYIDLSGDMSITSDITSGAYSVYLYQSSLNSLTYTGNASGKVQISYSDVVGDVILNGNIAGIGISQTNISSLIYNGGVIGIDAVGTGIDISSGVAGSGIDSIEIYSDISATGDGVAFDRMLYGNSDILVEGNVTASGNGYDIDRSKLGVVSIIGDITTTGGDGIYATGYDAGAMTMDSFSYTGTINSSSEGIYFTNTSGNNYIDIAGNITISGDITSGGSSIRFYGVDGGDFSYSGNASNSIQIQGSDLTNIDVSGSAASFYYGAEGVKTLTSFSFIGDTTSGGVTIGDAPVENDIVINGNTHGMSMVRVTGDNIYLTQLNTLGYDAGVYISGSSFSGDMVITGDMTGLMSGYGMYVSGTTADSLSYTGNTTEKMFVGGTFINGVNITGNVDSQVYLSNLYASVDFIGDITNDAGIGLYLNVLGTNGDVTVNGNISASSYGIDLYDLSGDLTINGNIDSTSAYALRLASTNSAGVITNNGIMSSDSAIAIYIQQSSFTIDSIVNTVMGQINSGIDYYAIYNNGMITNGIINNGVISGDITNSGTIGGITFGEGSVHDGLLRNNGTIISETGAGIQYMGSSDDVLNYTGTGVLTGLVVGIDMGAGNDTLNMSGNVNIEMSLANVEQVNVSDAVGLVNLTEENRDGVLANWIEADVSITNLSIKLSTTADVIDNDTDGKVTLLSSNSLSTDGLTTTINMQSLSDTYGGIIQQTDTELVLHYGAKVISFNGEYVRGLEGEIDCTSGTCTLGARDILPGTELNLTNLIISDVAEDGGVDELVIGDNETVLNYTENKDVITVSGSNYMNLINNADINHFYSSSSANAIEFASNSVLNGDFIQNGDIDVVRGYVLYLNSGTQINGDVILNGNMTGYYGTQNSGTATINGNLVINGNLTTQYHGVYFNNTTVTGDVIVNGNIDAKYYGLWLNGVDGQIIINGNISGGGTALQGEYASQIINKGHLISTDNDGIEIKGALLNDITGIIESHDESSAGVEMFETLLTGDIINKGQILSTNDGVRLASWDNDPDYIISGQINNSGIIDGRHRGLMIFAYDVQKTIINSGTISAETGTYINPYGGKNQTYGVFILEANTAGIENTSTGIIQGQYGIGLSAEHYDGDYAGRLDNDTDLTVHNDGQIIGSKYAAIGFDVTAKHGSAGSYDNTLNYSGTGTLSGAVYDIDMGDGNDTVNITNAVVAYPKMNSVETVNVTNSTLELVLTELNKSDVLTDASGTDTLTLENIIFNVNTNRTKLNSGEQITLFDVATLNVDLDTLTINFDTFDSTGGYFSLIDGVDSDQLIYVFDTFENNQPTPDQPAQVNPASAVSVSLRSVDVATTVSTQILSNIQKRQLLNKYSKIERSHDFGQSSEIQSDVNLIFGKELADENGIWIQIFGEKDKYDGTEKGVTNSVSSTGYDASLQGITIGNEYKLSKHMLGGLAFSNVTGTVDGKNNLFETDVNSVQISGYVSYQEDKFFIDGILGYGIGMYNQERDAGDGIARSDYDNQQLSAQVNIGQVMFAGENWIITPFVKSVYIVVDQNAYKETKNGTALSVDGVSQESIRMGGGLEAGYIVKTAGGHYFLPRINFEYANELGDNGMVLESTILETNVPGAALTSPDMGMDIYTIGAGITYVSPLGHQIILDYQKETRENYTSDSFFIKGKYVF